MTAEWPGLAQQADTIRTEMTQPQTLTVFQIARRQLIDSLHTTGIHHAGTRKIDHHVIRIVLWIE